MAKPLGLPPVLLASARIFASGLPDAANNGAAASGLSVAPPLIPGVRLKALPSAPTQPLAGPSEIATRLSHGRRAVSSIVGTLITPIAPRFIAIIALSELRCAPSSLGVPLGKPGSTTANLPLDRKR